MKKPLIGLHIPILGLYKKYTSREKILSAFQLCVTRAFVETSFRFHFPPCLCILATKKRIEREKQFNLYSDYAFRLSRENIS